MAPRGVRDAAVEGWLAGGGEMGVLMRSFDGSRTVLGPVSGWPTSLKTMAGVVLNNRFPMLIWWGPELIQAVYNDAYRPILGNKHPASLGAPGHEVGAEIWDVIGSMARGVLDGGPATWSEHLLLWMQRRGFVEETYFTFSYSPIPDDEGRVGGVLVTVHETTEQIQDDRQLRMLRDLAAHASDATSAEEACRTAAAIFASNEADLPFVLLYLADGREGEARLVGESGLAGYEGPAKPAAIPLRGERARATWPLAAAAHAGREVLVDDLAARFGTLPGGRWGSPPARAIVLPLTRPGQSEPYGFLVAGVSPHRLLDERYCGLFRLAAAQVVTTIGLVARVELHLQLAELRHHAVREREKMYALFMQAPVAIASLRGPRHVFELANPHYETMVGKMNLAGRAYVDVFPELVDHPIIGILDRVYTTGVPYVTDELRIDIDRGSGLVEESHFSFNLFPVRGESKEPEGFLCVAVDVTERVRARKRLEEAMQEREELLVREQEARHQAESANRSKDEFLAMLGHELRNPLAPIMTALYLMRMRAGDVAARERAVIERQVKHLAQLVDDLLDVSRITRGKVELKNERLEVAEVVAKAIEMASPLLEQRRHHLTVEVPSRGLVVDGDGTRLAQVMSNLLTNAAKYTESGGQIMVEAERRGRDVEIRVRDNGIGIPADVLPSVFDFFVQDRQSLDRAQGGLGLGLAIVRNLVTMHGGTVAARSEGKGRGSEFVVRLPGVAGLSEGDVVRTQGDAPVRAAVGGRAGHRILVVDDNEDAAMLLAESLGSLGHQTRVATDGPSALRLAEKFRPDIALLDIGLPVMDGYELAHRLRERPELDQLRLIAVTGYGQASDRSLSQKAGFDAHLVKPVPFEQLAGLVEELFGQEGEA